MVSDYEQKVVERAKELERARIKEEEAQKLLMEAEGLKINKNIQYSCQKKKGL